MGKLIKSRIKERMSSRRKPRPVPRENGDRVFLSPHCLLQQIAEPTGSISACTTQRGMEFDLSRFLMVVFVFGQRYTLFMNYKNMQIRGCTRSEIKSNCVYFARFLESG
uniref:Uncharacterized protein n=1 Tax=Magallana gigas TaxID=29159 RepID=A0A8W8MTU3_MAGGI